MTLNVWCVWVANKYPIQYVENLYNMVQRHLTLEHTFNCITDKPEQIPPHIKAIQSPAGITGWWNKLYLFSPELDNQGINLYFDLDVVIISSLNKFILYDQNKFIVLQDFNRAFHPDYHVYNSSIMKWSKPYHEVWNEFATNPPYWQGKYHGDQNWITKKIPEALFLPRDWAISWKWEYPAIKTDDTSVLVFHGLPKPHESAEEIITSNWK